MLTSFQRLAETGKVEFLGETYNDSGDSARALEHLTAAHRLASVLAPHGDLMMEVARRRGEAYAAAGNQRRALEDLSRAISISRSRGETRELALSQRAMALASPSSPSTFSDVIQDVLSALHHVGDHFEYARTVCLAMENERLQAGRCRAKSRMLRR